MLEMHTAGPGEATLREDGVDVGGASWELRDLAWGREKVKVAVLTRFEASEQNVQPLWAYLEYLWQPQGVAAVKNVDGTLRWFHRALQKSWEAAGSPGV